jgi:hypothetical protein
MARSTALIVRPPILPPALMPVPEEVTASPLREICHQLMDLQVHRRFQIVSQSRLNRAIESMIVHFSGARDRESVSKEEYKRLHAWAKNLRERIEKAGELWTPPDDPTGVWQRVTIAVLQSANARAIFDGLRASTERDMEALARQLPVWQWVKGVKGVAEKGLGVIVGETGDLTIDGNFPGSYSNPAKVWKRLGLAVFDGRRQGNPGKVATTEDWIMHGYSPKRRAEAWAFLSDIMFRAQWRGARDEDGKDPKTTGKEIAVPAHPIGPYGELYAERKAWDLARGWTPAHADKDARRIMSKRFLRDLWVEWNRPREAKVAMKSYEPVPPAA